MTTPRHTSIYRLTAAADEGTPHAVAVVLTEMLAQAIHRAGYTIQRQHTPGGGHLEVGFRAPTDAHLAAQVAADALDALPAGTVRGWTLDTGFGAHRIWIVS